MTVQPSVKLFILGLILSFLSNGMHAQQTLKIYSPEWKKVDELITKKNLPKSALEEVKKIYALAKKEKQDAQVIKSLIYMSDLQQETRENNSILSIKETEKEISTAAQPSKSILQSLLAGMYWNYFQSVRWQLYNRTATVNFTKEDIATWSAPDFHRQIAVLYLQSISGSELLKKTKLEPYDAIIMEGNVRKLRPTLYDLLANRALSYFKNDENDMARPANAFEISDASALGPADDFIHRKFETTDSTSLHQKALLLYQELIAFHLHDEDPSALIDIDLDRLQFVKENSTNPGKDGQYRLALNHIVRKYEEIPAAAQAWYLLAEEYNSDADGYKPLGDTAHRYDRIRAKEICEKVLTSKDTTEGWVNCYNLLNRIMESEFSFQLEKVNVPAKPFRVYVEYKNTPVLYLRLVKAGKKLKDDIGGYFSDESWASLLKAPVFKTWQQTLPGTKDYQQHSVEIPAEGLAAGEYFLIASSRQDFTDKKAALGAKLFYVSNISYVNQTNDFFLLDRTTGQPLVNASVQTWNQLYDYKKSEYIAEKGKQYTTDRNGFFRLATEKQVDNNRQRENYKLEITYNNDKLFMDDWIYDAYYYRNNNAVNQDNIASRNTFFFTDRSIYRPGQTVYFKAIIIMPDKEKKNVVLADYKTKIYLRDANYQVIDSIEVTTNEYGSVSGKFQLPQNGLNGQFSIYEKGNRGTCYFSMEEYKRPKFYVDYDTLRGTYKVNDSIKITGFARAYAGNNIDGALVKYRVVRQPRYLYPWVFKRWWMPPSASVEIIHGEINTSGEGKFEITFKAIADKTIDKKFEPVFDYTVYADVTDINGETRSGETYVSVSYKSLILKSDIPASLPADSLKSLIIRTENMNGEFQPALVKVSVSKLQEEKRLIRERYWDQPDEHILTKEEYIKLFPNDEYAAESDYENWEKGSTVFEKTDSLKKDKELTLEGNKFMPGYYEIEIVTKDKEGEEVKDIKYIELYDEKAKQLNRPQYLWTRSSSAIQPGEKTSIGLGTSADNLYVISQVDKPGSDNKLQTIDYKPQTINKEIKFFDFSAEESDRGGYGVTYFFVKDNRFFEFNNVITVPWTIKNLHVEFETFRDKTLPGSEEKWKLRITGYKSEKVAAEMLASMYDASLDQFSTHNWSMPYIWPSYYNRRSWSSDDNFSKIESEEKYIAVEREYFEKEYDELTTNITSLEVANGFLMRRSYRSEDLMYIVAKPVQMDANPSARYDMAAEEKAVANKISFGFSTTADSSVAFKNDGDGVTDHFEVNKIHQDNAAVQIRKNFNETAFFFPDLRTDSSGVIEFSFTAPEALTKWKLQALAHTKDLAFGMATQELVTQKELMVQPNAPRFMREGDKLEFSAKVVNMTGKEITGQAQLLLFDASTDQSVDGWFQNMFPNQYFTVAAGQSEAVKFPIEVPYLFDKALTWRVVARAGDVSDGEEASLPVLTNRMLVTESLPLNMRGNATKEFRFEKLLQSGNSETLKHHALTVEYTSNPAWYAVQALPYLMEYPYECAEQTWNRYYANALASMIANSSPKIKQVFESWKTKDTAALLSNLQKNEELKAVLLEETPWVLDAKNEAEQKKNIALLFDMVKMSEQLNNAIEKLKQLQSPNGGFVWFKGGPDNRYITQYIVTGIGHLYRLNAVSKEQKAKLDAILKTAVPYLDKKIKEDYDNLVKSKVKLTLQNIGYTQVQYLYMRSFFPGYAVPAASQTAYNYYRKQSQQFWLKQNKYAQGMIALSLYRSKDTKTPAAILKSLKETSITNDELGMYWKDQNAGWYWYQAPVETQALLIEAFGEIGKDTKTVDDLKTWLLKNKQTNNWKTTKATAEACYALLIKGSRWLNEAPVVTIQLGDAVMNNSSSEDGTGYFKKTIDGNFVNDAMGKITVTQKFPADPAKTGQSSTSWGSVYWQYFEDLDKITTASTPLGLVKKLFVEKNTDTGPVLAPVNEGDFLKVGDKIKVRIELRVDRDMEYVHMKDMRAGCMEPVDVLSGYRWQDGLGYYETTKDASTNFFFDYLRKGTYVFEYSLFVTHKGDFSNGVTSIQCMYAPEFTSHSEGIRVNVE